VLSNQELSMHKLYSLHKFSLERRKIWRELVTEFNSSNLTLGDFAKKHELHSKDLSRWVYKLKPKAGNAKFVAVDVVNDDNTASGNIRLFVADNYQILLENNFNAKVLGQLLDTLEAR